MTLIESIFKGNTAGPWLFGHVVSDVPRPLTIDDTCLIKVVDGGIERAVTERTLDALHFNAWLTPAETSTLTNGKTYVVVLQIENTTLSPPLRIDRHILLTIEANGIGAGSAASPPTAIDGLREELRQVRAARLTYFTGGVVQKVRGGRYATEMWYASPKSLAEYDVMIETLEREIAAAELVTAGRPKRTAIGTYYL